MIPILYESEHLSVQTYWLFIAIALLAGSYIAVKRLKRRRVNFNLFIRHSTSFLIAALIGARTVYFFMNTDAYFPGLDLRTLWNFFSIWDQGLSLWGGFLGFMATLLYYIWRAKENVWKWLDALSVPVAAGLILIKVGEFLGGYAYGTPTDLPWGVSYDVYTVKYTVPIHPTQLYTIAFIALVLWIKYQLKARNKTIFSQDGMATLYFSSTLGLGFFFLEFLRGDDTLELLGMRFSSLAFLAVGLISLLILYRRHY